MTDTPTVEAGNDALPKARRCHHCDLSMGTRGMDRCGKCDGTGSGFQVGLRFFPNTQEGYEAALEARIRSDADAIAKLRAENEMLKATLNNPREAMSYSARLLFQQRELSESDPETPND